MTSVVGHIMNNEFIDRYRKWSNCRPIELFEARIEESVTKVRSMAGNFLATDQGQDKEAVANNITNQAKWCKALFIWTDCDREGEHIGGEVRQMALKGNPRLEVKRARFSNTERA